MVSCTFDVEVASIPAFAVSIGDPGRGFGQVVFEVALGDPATAFDVEIESIDAFTVSIAQDPTFGVEIASIEDFSVEIGSSVRFTVNAFGSGGGGDLNAADQQKLNSISAGATRDLNPGVITICNFNVIQAGQQFTVQPSDGILSLAKGRIPRNAFSAGGIVRFFVTGSISFDTTGTVTAYFEHNDSTGASGAPIGTSHVISSGNFQLEADLTNNVFVFNATNGIQQLFAKFRAPNASAVVQESVAQSQAFFNFLHIGSRNDGGVGIPYELSDIGIALSVTGSGGVLTVFMCYGEVHGLASNRNPIREPSAQQAPRVINP